MPKLKECGLRLDIEQTGLKFRMTFFLVLGLQYFAIVCLSLFSKNVDLGLLVHTCNTNIQGTEVG